MKRLFSSIAQPLATALLAALVLAACVSQAPSPVEHGAGTGKSASTITDGYTVKKGDTLYSIALEHGLDYRDLINWNNIENPNRILVGQVLRTRAPGSSAHNPGSGAVVVKPISSGTVEQKPLGATTDTLKREPKAGKEPYSEQALVRAQQKPVEPTVAAVKAAAKPESRTEAKSDGKPESKAESGTEEKGGEASGNEEIAWGWPASGKLLATFSEGGNKGIDIGGRAGEAVVAASGGKVVYSGSGLRGYGKLVIVKHNNNFLTAYAHNQNILVKEGQMVNKGQKIAEMGNTDTDQVKLHFEVRRQGKPVDPLKFLPQR